MNIRDLEYLVALAEHRHFRRAADSCHVSQPTLSGQIRKLEDELGVMLLERTSRKVLFTQAGLLLVDQARTVLREVKVLKEMASQQGETMSGPLHIGLIPTIGPYLLPLIIPMLHQTFPKLEMYLHEAQTHQLLAQLDSGKLDALAVPQERKRDGVVYVPCIKPEPRRTVGLVYRPGSPLRSRYEHLAEAIRSKMDGHFDAALKQAV